MQKTIRAWAEISHDIADGELTGVYVQIQGHRVWLTTAEASQLAALVDDAKKAAHYQNRGKRKR